MTNLQDQFAQAPRIEILADGVVHGPEGTNDKQIDDDLIGSIIYGRKNSARHQLSQNIHINALCEYNFPPISAAKCRGDDTLLAKHRKECQKSCSCGDIFFGTALHAAVIFGDQDLIRDLVSRGADMTIEDQRGRTPAVIAVGSGRLRNLEVLVELDTELKKPEKLFELLLLAVEENQMQTARFLIKLRDGTHLQNSDNINKIVGYAIKYNSLETVKLLFQRGAKINQQDLEGLTPLHRAAMEGNEPCVDWLLENGASADITDHSDKYPLQTAVKRKHKSISIKLYPRTTERIAALSATDWRLCAGMDSECSIEMVGGQGKRLKIWDQTLKKMLLDWQFPLAINGPSIKLDDFSMKVHNDDRHML